MKPITTQMVKNEIDDYTGPDDNTEEILETIKRYPNRIDTFLQLWIDGEKYYTNAFEIDMQKSSIIFKKRR